MHETTLLKLALTCTLLGLPLIFITSSFVHVKETVEYETIEGTIAEVNVTNETTLVLTNTLTIPDALDVTIGGHATAKGNWQNNTFVVKSLKVD